MAADTTASARPAGHGSRDAHARLILDGHLWTVTWKLALPAVAVMILFGLNALLDAIFVGQLIGEQALAGVSLAYPLAQLNLGLASLVGTGAAAALSIAIGAGDTRTLRRLPGVTLSLAAVLAGAFALVGLALAEPMVRGMGARGELVPIAASYFRAAALGGFGMIGGLALNMLLRGEGKMALAAKYMGIGLLLNVILTPLFIAGFGWGVAGAAWATNIGLGFGGWLVWRRIRAGRSSYAVDTGYLGLDRRIVHRILRLGLPALIMSTTGVLQAFVVFNVLTRVGTESDIAFYGATMRVMLFMLTPLFGLMRAMQPVAGMNYGAGNWDRVIRGYWTFVAAGTAMVVPVWIFMTAFPETTLSLMLPGMAFTAEDLHHFRIFILVLPVLPLVFTGLTLLPAVEQPGKATLLSLSRQLLFYVPVMLTLPFIIGVPGVYYGSMAIDFICTAWCLWLVLSVFRKKPGPDRPAPAAAIAGSGSASPSPDPADRSRAGAESENPGP